MTVTDIPQAATRHAAVAKGLKAFAGFLEGHPDLPVGGGGNPLRVPVYGGTDEENRAEIDRIASILRTAPVCDETGTYYSAEHDFGGGVIYSATAISQSEHDHYHEHMRSWRPVVAA